MGLLNMELFSNDELEHGRIRYKELIHWFNRIADERQGELDRLGYMDFHRMAKSQLLVEEWIEFMSDHRVAQLLDKIMLLNMRSIINKLLSNETDRSVAQSQRLNSALGFMGKHFDKAMGMETTKFIYSSVPLTENEKHSPHARVLYVKPKKNPHNPATLK